MSLQFLCVSESLTQICRNSLETWENKFMRNHTEIYYSVPTLVSIVSKHFRQQFDVKLRISLSRFLVYFFFSPVLLDQINKWDFQHMNWAENRPLQIK